MNRVLCVMALTCCVAALAAVVSPVRADTSLLQENFDEAGAGNPGARLGLVPAGLEFRAVPEQSHDVQRGNFAEWRTRPQPV